MRDDALNKANAVEEIGFLRAILFPPAAIIEFGLAVADGLRLAIQDKDVEPWIQDYNKKEFIEKIKNQIKNLSKKLH